MKDFDSLVISSASSNDFPEACQKVAQALPKEIRIRLNNVLLYCVERYGVESAYKRINNRSVSQILAEYQFAEYQPEDLKLEDSKLIASGEVDGMRYELYDAPPPPTDADGSDGQS
jgi:hypothetical protein